MKKIRIKKLMLGAVLTLALTTATGFTINTDSAPRARFLLPISHNSIMNDRGTFSRLNTVN